MFNINRSIITLALLVIGGITPCPGQEDKSINYEQLAIDYFANEVYRTDSVFRKLCIQFNQDSLIIDSRVYFVGLYTCFHDSSMLEEYRKELDGNRNVDKVRKTVNLSFLNAKNCEDYKKSKLRTIEVKGATYFNQRVYVKIVLISKSKVFGESLFLEFKKDSSKVLRTCFSDWVI